MVDSPAAFRPGQVAAGTVIGIASHAVVLGVAYVVGRIASGGGLEGLGNIARALVLGEGVVGLACLIGGGVLFARGQRELGLGLVVGWILGLVIGCVLARS